MKKLFHSIAFIALSFLSINCSEKETVVPVHPVDNTNNGFESFAVAEIFAVNCAESGCHGGAEPHHALSLESWDGLVHGSYGRPLTDTSHHHKVVNPAHGETPYGGGVVVPFNAEKSLLYNLLIGNVEDHTLTMPYNRTQLPQSQIDAIKTWINNGARSFSGEVPYQSAQNKIYACAQGSDEVYVIDPDRKAVSAVIDVDFLKSANDQPHNIQIKNGFIYVTLISTGRFLKYDINSLTLVGFVDGLVSPGMIMISPDGKKAYVSKSSTAQGDYNTIYVIDTESMTRNTDISLTPGLPHAIALSSDGATLYAANLTKDRISILNTVTGEYVEDIVLSPGSVSIHEPMHMYISPDDKYLYVNCRKSKKMLVIDAQTKNIITELVIQEHPMYSAISRDGNKIYVVSHHHPYITEITKTGNSWEITNEFQSTSFHHLYGADLSPDGRYLYVTCSNDEDEFKARYQKHGQTRAALLCIYDTQTHEIVRILDIGSYATGIVSR